MEDEGPQREEDEVDQMVEEMSMIGEEGESPVPEEGSGVYEGSASEGPFIADRAFVTAESETGSGESWKVNDMERNQGNFSFPLPPSCLGPHSFSLICPCCSACRWGRERLEAVAPQQVCGW